MNAQRKTKYRTPRGGESQRTKMGGEVRCCVDGRIWVSERTFNVVRMKALYMYDTQTKDNLHLIRVL